MRLAHLAAHLAAVLLLLSSAGCESGPSERQPVARDVTRGPAEAEGPAERPEQVSTPDRGGGLGDQYRAAEGWRDGTQGPLATLVYVTETGARGQRKPAALIWTSDPESRHFKRKGTAQITVRRLYKEEMGWLLRELERTGLESLPWGAEEEYDKDIGPERALHVYRDGRRRYVLKDGLGEAQRRTFRKLEDRLIQLTLAR